MVACFAVLLVAPVVDLCAAPVFDETSNDFSEVPYYHATEQTVRKQVGQGVFAGTSLTYSYESEIYLGVRCLRQTISSSTDTLDNSLILRAVDTSGQVWVFQFTFQGEIIFEARNIEELVPDENAISLLPEVTAEVISYEAVLPQFPAMQFKKVSAVIDGFEFFYYYHETVGIVLTVANETGDVRGDGWILEDFPSKHGTDIKLFNEHILDVGNSWSYLLTSSIENNIPVNNTVSLEYTISEKRDFEGVLASVININSKYGSREVFWSMTEDHIVEVASNTNNNELHKIIYNNDIYELWPIWINSMDNKNHVGHGQFFVTQDNPSAVWVETYDSYLTYLGSESITTPSGTYDCQKVLVREEWSDTDDFWGYAEETLWINFDLNIIRGNRTEYEWDAFNFEGTKNAGVYELISTNVTPPLKQYKLNISITGNGDVEDIEGFYDEGQIVALHAYPDDGYLIKQWIGTIDDLSKSNHNSVLIDKDKTVAVVFEETPVENLTILNSMFKAGKNRHDNSDSFSLSAMIDIPESRLADTQRIIIELFSGIDSTLIYQEYLTFNINNLKKGKYSYKGGKSGIVSLKIDTNKHILFLEAKNIDLTGLKSPVVLGVDTSFYLGEGTAAESVEEYLAMGQSGSIAVDAINGKKPMPINFLYGQENFMRVDKCTFKLGTKPSTDSLTIQGAIAVEDTSADIAGEDIVVSWGDYDITLPANDLFRIGSEKAFKYKKSKETNISIASAIFDLEKCTFKIVIKNANISSQNNPIDFSIQFADFSKTVTLQLTVNRPDHWCFP